VWTSRLLGRRPAARFERDQIFLLGAELTKVYANRHGSKQGDQFSVNRVGMPRCA
jgi:hypothetical protein